MATFKDYLANDLDVFFNTDEMASMYNVNGEDIEVIVDNEGLIESKIKYEGVFEADLLFYIKKSDIEEPIIEEHIEFDQSTYLIKAVDDEVGMYKILAKEVMG